MRARAGAWLAVDCGTHAPRAIEAIDETAEDGDSLDGDDGARGRVHLAPVEALQLPCAEAHGEEDDRHGQDPEDEAEREVPATIEWRSHDAEELEGGVRAAAARGEVRHALVQRTVDEGGRREAGLRRAVPVEWAVQVTLVQHAGGATRLRDTRTRLVRAANAKGAGKNRLARPRVVRTARGEFA